MLAAETSGKEKPHEQPAYQRHTLQRESPKASSDNDQMVHQTNGTTSRHLSKRSLDTQMYLISQACSGYPFFCKLSSTKTARCK